MNILAKLALGICTIILISGCRGSDTESDEQAVLKSTFKSDFEWAVDQMEDLYDDYNIETGAWRLLEISEIYATSANEMNGLDYAVTMIIEFAIKGPSDKKWEEGGGQYPWQYGSEKKPPYCGPSNTENWGYAPAEPIKIQVTSWNGDRQLPCLRKLKEDFKGWTGMASKQQ